MNAMPAGKQRLSAEGEIVVRSFGNVTPSKCYPVAIISRSSSNEQNVPALFAALAANAAR